MTTHQSHQNIETAFILLQLTLWLVLYARSNISRQITYGTLSLLDPGTGCMIIIRLGIAKGFLKGKILSCIFSISASLDGKAGKSDIIIIIILSFDIAPFPYKHAQRRITFIVKE